MNAYHSLLPQSDQARLRVAGMAAFPLRQPPLTSNHPEYVEAVASIDAIAAGIRASNPDAFWREDDPVYMALKAKWAQERMDRKNAQPVQQ